MTRDRYMLTSSCCMTPSIMRAASGVIAAGALGEALSEGGHEPAHCDGAGEPHMELSPLLPSEKESVGEKPVGDELESEDGGSALELS